MPASEAMAAREKANTQVEVREVCFSGATQIQTVAGKDFPIKE